MVARPVRTRRFRWTGAFGLACAIALIAVPVGTAAGPPDLTGTWANPADNSSYQLTSSGDRKTLTAGWRGAAGPHANLVGSFQGTLDKAGSAYAGSFHVSEGSVSNGGPMTFKIDSPTRLTVTYQQNGGGATFTLVRKSAPAPSGAAPSGTLTIATATGSKLEVQRDGAPWEAGALGMQLKPGDRIHTGWKTSITVTFPDGSTATVAPMSLVQIKEISADGKQRVFLTLGEVTVEIQQLPGSRGDFRVITPTTTASVRGTRFSVLYDGSETIVSVIQHRVVVKPRHGRAVVVNQGHEVSSIARSVGRPVAIGRAGARARALAPAKAIALLTASISSGIDACQAKAYSVTLAHRSYGWRATLHVQAAPSFDALWKIAGRRVTAMNSAAKAIAAGCAR